MRNDNATFSAGNYDTVKDPRYTIELSFDEANTNLYYITSHSDSATPASVTVVASVINGVSVTSQQVQPEKALASVGNISFSVVDRNNAIRSMIGSELAFGNSLKAKRVRIYMGYAGDDWSTYIPVQTQVIDDVTYENTIYTFNCSDAQRFEKKDIFDMASTTLATTLSIGDTVVTVYDTSLYEAVTHSSYWSDAPSQTVYYIKIDDEVIRATGKTATTFTGCTRGALNTKEDVHTVNNSDVPDRRPEVLEYMYLELPAPKMIYAIMTGILHNDAANLPSSWNLGMSTDYVRLSDFTGIGDDLWNLADESVGALLRFEGEDRQDGKKFIEEQINLPIACFNIIYATGELGLVRMTSVISDAPSVLILDESNIVSYSTIRHDMDSVRNHLVFKWNWDTNKEKFTRTNILFDTQSIALHGKSKPASVEFRGVHGSIHTSATIEGIFDSLRDRFSDPPLKLEVTTMFSNNGIEVGDIVTLDLSQIMDYNVDSTLNRSFEVQRISVDWIKGTVTLSLFGSAAKPGTIVRAATTTVLSDAFYVKEGNDLKTYVGGGYDATTDYLNNKIISSTTLTGGDDLKNSLYIYYHDGDLTIDVGVVVTINKNVQLRVKGVLTVNGKIDGKGSAGVASGFSGYVGTSQAQGGMNLDVDNRQGYEWVNYSTSQPVTSGSFAAVPELFLLYDSTLEVLNGLPSDLRGSIGGSGGTVVQRGSLLANGGSAGLAGSGMMFIGRGFVFGASGSVDLSGTDGAVGGGGSTSWDSIPVGGGGGAGGSSGSMHIILDGSTAVAVFDSSNAILCRGSVPNRYGRIWTPGRWVYDRVVSLTGYYAGLNNGCQFQSQQRVQYVPSPVVVQPDIPSSILTPPSSLTAQSGTAQLLVEIDGTIVPRVLLTWSPAIDPDVVGYEVEYKQSADTIWIGSTNVLGADSSQTYVLGVNSGTSYDFRIRSAAGDRTSSVWIEVLNHTVLGKSAPPSDVSAFNVYANAGSAVFKWDQVSDVDLAGYEIRYVQRVSGLVWADGTPLTSVTRGTNVTSADAPDGDWTFMIKAVDTSGNYSVNSKDYDIVLSSVYDIITSNTYEPDWKGTLTSMIKTFNNKLIANGTVVVNLEGWETFDTFNPNPVAFAYYEIPAEVDYGFDGNIRVWADISSALPPTSSGAANPTLMIDHRLDAGVYDGWQDWSVGELFAAAIKGRIVVDTSIGMPAITGFTFNVDAVEFSQRAENVVVGSGGLAVVFPQPFHLQPFVEVLVQGAVALFPTRDLLSVTGFTVHVFDSSGTEVGGTIDWKATGV